MRQKIVAGNWKCNTNLQEGVELAKAVDTIVAEQGAEDVVVVLGVPFTHLTKVAETVNTERIGVASQNCAAEAKGAYTGEVSVSMIKSTGAKYVILGHSERREYFGETDALLAKKVDAALSNKMEVIFCFGEVLEDRKSGKHFEVVESQIKNGLFHLEASAWETIVLAYEPVWAIGTGETASPEQAQEMHAFIRKIVADKYNQEIANTISILYGGSVKPSNDKEIFSKEDVDGGLIGGAALNADDFIELVKSF